MAVTTEVRRNCAEPRHFAPRRRGHMLKGEECGSFPWQWGESCLRPNEAGGTKSSSSSQSTVVSHRPSHTLFQTAPCVPRWPAAWTLSWLWLPPAGNGLFLSCHVMHGAAQQCSGWRTHSQRSHVWTFPLDLHILTVHGRLTALQLPALHNPEACECVYWWLAHFCSNGHRNSSLTVFKHSQASHIYSIKNTTKHIRNLDHKIYLKEGLLKKRSIN